MSREPGKVPMHLTENEFVGYAADSLPKADMERVEKHLSSCEQCLASMERLMELDFSTPSPTSRKQLDAIEEQMDSLALHAEELRRKWREEEEQQQDAPRPVWKKFWLWFAGGKVGWLRPALSAAAACGVLALVFRESPGSPFPASDEEVTKGNEASIRANAANVSLPTNHFLSGAFRLTINLRKGELQLKYPNGGIYKGSLLRTAPELDQPDEPSEHFLFEAEGKSPAQEKVFLRGAVALVQEFGAPRLATNRVARPVRLKYIALDADAVVENKSTNLFLRATLINP